MITEITMHGNETCYKNVTKLNCVHKINLIYGLNGVGKSTLSNYLYTYPNVEERYSKCEIKTLADDDELVVYNQQFVQENFYESENQKGIFSLNSENKEALTAIDNANRKIESLTSEKEEIDNKLTVNENDIKRNEKKAETKTWEIKTKYTGGDRILDCCFDGLGIKSSSEKLFKYLLSKNKPVNEPRNLDEIKKDIQLLSSKTVNKIEEIIIPDYLGFESEGNSIFSKVITGSKNSTISKVIDKLKNSDWVKSGLKYLPASIEGDAERCPFCQEFTITNNFIKKIEEYFNEDYENDKTELEELCKSYQLECEKIPTVSIVDNCSPAEEYRDQLNIALLQLKTEISKNIELMKKKMSAPSLPIELSSTEKLFLVVKEVLNKINDAIRKQNDKIEQRETNLAKTKKEFWNRMRIDYDTVIMSYHSENQKLQTQKNEFDIKLNQINKDIEKEKSIIVKNQSLTVNIDDAIKNINASLLDLGISDFSIKKHDENLYTIIRDDNEAVFKSLSEGEKMVISFLYFIELCKGKKSTLDVHKKRIVVIDDPISSLSHIYVFNIGRLIQNEFIRSKNYEQVFILSHSLYFIYELVDNNKERRKNFDEKMYRIVKNLQGSIFVEMNYEEVQNDYHSYWAIIKDMNQHPALIANCLRNIIDYFFNFVEKTDLNNVFQKSKFNNQKYLAFMRYINRESHSLGENIFDIKEFDYSIFFEAFKSIFIESGYEDHFNKMMEL